MGTICRARGCTTALLLALAAPLLAQGGSILPPEAPPFMPPPPEKSEENLPDRRRRIQQQQQQQQQDPAAPRAQESTSAAPPESPTKTLDKEANINRPYRLLMIETLVLPKIKISGPERRGYSAEPTLFWHGLMRLTEGIKKGGLDVFAGLRLAPLSGIGTYDGQAGRYGFLYFGPIVALGRFNLARPLANAEDGPERIGNDAKTEEGKLRDEEGLQTGWLVLAGMAAQSRFGSYDRRRQAPADDLNSRSLGADPPGIWAEAMLMQGFYSVLSVSPMAGIQIGRRKIFTYIGVGIGFWY